MTKYEKDYEEFWKALVENEDGTLNKEQVMRELSDFRHMINEVPKVYDEVTGGMISFPNADASVVIAYHNDAVNEWSDEVYGEGYENGYKDGYDVGSRNGFIDSELDK